MIIGSCQFKSYDSIDLNYKSILRCVEKASIANVKILFFHECAITGYPPIEIDNINNIDFEKVEFVKKQIQNLASKNNMTIIIGNINKIDSKFQNSMEIFSPNNTKNEPYNKRALWGWDSENFIPGNNLGIFQIDDLKIGIRICYEIRFPEYFRELFKEKVDIVFVAFCDVAEKDNIERYNLLMSHIRTRAVENAYTVITSNSISKFQTAPTCVIDSDGKIVHESEKNTESIIIFDFIKDDSNFGRNGRILESKKLTTAST